MNGQLQLLNPRQVFRSEYLTNLHPTMYLIRSYMCRRVFCYIFGICEDDFVVSTENISPGQHELTGNRVNIQGSVILWLAVGALD